MKTIQDIRNRCVDMFGNKADCCATDELLMKILKKDVSTDKYIAISYTDYGGTYLEKIFIQYLKETHPNNIIVENTVYFGENAIVFGYIVDDIIEASKDYPLGYEDFEDYYYGKEISDLEKAAIQFIKENNIPEDQEEIIYDYFRDVATMQTFGVDYSESDLERYIKDNLI